MAPTLRARVGAIAWAMSKFVHPSKPICDQYPNQPKNHKLEGIILLREDDKVVRRGTDPIPVFLFRHEDFPDKEFYCARRYVHVTQEGPESSLFVPPPPRGVPMETIATGANNSNRLDGAEANDMPSLLSGRTTNLLSEDMAELRRQGIAIDDDNDPAPENIPDRGAEPEQVVDNLNWKGEEGIICPRKAANLPNSFAGFTHYS